LRIHVIVKVIYFWTHRYPQHIVVHKTGLTPKTLTDFYNFCREVCYTILQQHSEPIGGPGTVVETDESKFVKRKYNRGKRVDGVWVFGGIERDTTPPKCFFLTVEDRSAATLIPIIKQYILPGTTIVSDCWKSYSSLRDEGSLHQTVNHSIEFVSESGTHTNNTESRWNALKKSLPRYGTRNVVRICTTHISLNTVFAVSFFVVPVTHFWHFSNSSVSSISPRSRSVSSRSNYLLQTSPVRRMTDYFRPRLLCQHPL